MAAHPMILQLCDAVLGWQQLWSPKEAPNVLLPYQIQLCLTIPKQPGSAAQQLHRDGDLSLLVLSLIRQ